MSKLFKVDLKDLASAVISAVIVAILGYLSSLANISDISFGQIVNIAFLTATASLVKAFSTDDEGMLLGEIKIK